jgi:hypothetical protein
MRFRFVMPAVALALLAGAARADGSVRVTARFPSVAVAGSSSLVRGQVHGWRRGMNVVVQRRRGGRWVLRGSAPTVSRSGRFRLAWRVPRRPGVVLLRVVAVARGSRRRTLAASGTRRVAVTATRVLRAARLTAAPPPGQAGLVRYAGRAPVRVGQFVAADVGPSTPAGLLGRVVSWRVVAGSTQVAIRPASLFDALPEGRLEVTPASASAARTGARPRPRRLAGAAAPRGAARGFRSALECGPGVEAEVGGSLAVRLIPALSLRWSLDGIDRAEAKVTLRGAADLRASIGAGGVCELPETSVARWDAPPLRFFAGPIPVVVVPRTNLFVSAEASSTAAVEAGIRGRISATAGLRYDGDVHAIGSFTHRFAHIPPESHVTGSLGARVIPSVTFLLYGRAGPRFDLSTGLQLDAEAGADPSWALSAPVELRAGFELPGLADLAIPQQTVFERSFPIAQAGGGASDGGASTSNPSPPAPAAPGSTPTSGPSQPASGPSQPASGPPSPPDAGAERARISWDTAATDVDLHVWDTAGNHAWFRDPGGIPGADLTEDDRYGFGPEHFRERTPRGRGVTYGLCYFDDSGAGRTTVSIRLTDPDGGVRELTRTLAREGDHVLLGSSPAGSGYVPPDGWCRP